MPRAALLLALLLVASAPLAAAEAPTQVLFEEEAVERVVRGTLAEGDARTFRFDWALPNLTRVEARLVWQETGDAAGVTRADRFALALQGPGGRADSGQSDAGELRVEARDVNAVPEAATLAPDELPAPRLEGQGAWEVTVELQDAGNADARLALDEENAYTLVVTFHHYRAIPLRDVAFNDVEPVTLKKPAPWGIAASVLALLVAALAAAIAYQGLRKRPKLLSPAVGDSASRRG